MGTFLIIGFAIIFVLLIDRIISKRKSVKSVNNWLKDQQQKEQADLQPWLSRLDTHRCWYKSIPITGFKIIAATEYVTLYGQLENEFQIKDGILTICYVRDAFPTVKLQSLTWVDKTLINSKDMEILANPKNINYINYFLTQRTLKDPSIPPYILDKSGMLLTYSGHDKNSVIENIPMAMGYLDYTTTVVPIWQYLSTLNMSLTEMAIAGSKIIQQQEEVMHAIRNSLQFNERKKLSGKVVNTSGVSTLAWRIINANIDFAIVVRKLSMREKYPNCQIRQEVLDYVVRDTADGLTWSIDSCEYQNLSVIKDALKHLPYTHAVFDKIQLGEQYGN